MDNKESLGNDVNKCKREQKPYSYYPLREYIIDSFQLSKENITLKFKDGSFLLRKKDLHSVLYYLIKINGSTNIRTNASVINQRTVENIIAITLIK